MSQQNYVGTDLISHVPQCVVPGGAGGSLGAALVTYLYCSYLHRIEPEPSALLGSGRCYIGRACLEAVVHDHRARPQP
jgi:hypothetical protein